MHILDNEASAAFKNAIKVNCTLQHVSPDTHRCNLAECAIRAFKNHYLAILAGVDKNFVIYLWDRLAPQAVLMLNLLRQAHATPAMSAYESINGKFDYNSLPLVLLGCAVQMHEAPGHQKTWVAHALNGWYIGMSMEYY